MLLFSAPTLLALIPIIVLAGLVALWRGKQARHGVSSTRLWQNLTDTASGTKKRSVDPLWLLVFLAALLAALALPGPRWRTGPDANAPTARIRWSVRNIGANPPELFLQVANAKNLGDRLAVEYLPGRDADPWPTNLTTSGDPVALADALRGTILRPYMPPDQTKLSVRLHEVASRTIVATATFLRPARPPFALLTQSAPDRTIDPALYRVFSINPSARPDDPRIHPAVLLVDDPHFTLDPGLATDMLLIASPDTPLPGLTPGDSFTPASPAPIPVSLPQFIHLENVRVRQARTATLWPQWTIEATLDGHPWLATRRLPNGPTLLWLASAPVHDTNWPLDKSFVLFFWDLLARVLPQPTPTTSSATAGIIDWQKQEPISPTTRSPAQRELALAPPLGIAAITLLLTATFLLTRRRAPPVPRNPVPLPVETLRF